MFISMLMKPICAATLGLLLIAPVAAQHTHRRVPPPPKLPSPLAPTPPMGWSSWDSYGLTINEEQFRQNMAVLDAQLKEFGWQYVVVDEGWYLQNPESASEPDTQESESGSEPDPLRYTLNAAGQYEPAPGRFPSAAGGTGFKTLADAAHQNGLKFGIDILRGIPRQTFTANTRIGRTAFRAKAATDPTDVCPWNSDNFGVKSNAAGQAWYDTLMKQYASWGVDLIKVDCIASEPYKPAEIKMIHRAIERSGRPMLLSLSPGPTALDNAAEVAANAQMWQISNDVWDSWDKASSTTQDLKDQFAVAASWVQYAKPGNWPDADTLPIGELQPAPVNGPPRTTRLTEDEQRTMFTLWCMARSPLFVGANLASMDGFTKSLLTNPGLIAIDQQSVNNKLQGQDGDVVAWTADSSTGPSNYLALFNLGDASVNVESTFATYGFQNSTYKLRDVWERKELGEHSEISVDLPAHGAVLLELKP